MATICLVVFGVAALVGIAPNHVIRIKDVIRNITHDEFDLRSAGGDLDRSFENTPGNASDLRAFLLGPNFTFDRVALDLSLALVFAQHVGCHAHKKIRELIVQRQAARH